MYAGHDENKNSFYNKTTIFSELAGQRSTLYFRLKIDIRTKLISLVIKYKLIWCTYIKQFFIIKIKPFLPSNICHKIVDIEDADDIGDFFLLISWKVLRSTVFKLWIIWKSDFDLNEIEGRMPVMILFVT